LQLNSLEYIDDVNYDFITQLPLFIQISLKQII
ncbi:transposase, partial [Lactobacillus crispatus]